MDEEVPNVKSCPRGRHEVDVMPGSNDRPTVVAEERICRVRALAQRSLSHAKPLVRSLKTQTRSKRQRRETIVAQ